VIGVTNPDLKLKPGMTANVSIKIAHRDDVLQIKNAALRYRPPDATPAETRSTSSPSGGREHRADRAVYLLNGNHPKPVQIKTGISDGIVMELLEGLKEGNRVITAEITSTSAASPPPNPFTAGPSHFR
jgi:HlyD family secretion protein